MDQIEERKECWLVTTNTDLTEGRGTQYAKYVCWAESTALRLAKGIDVQGSNGTVFKSFAYKISSQIGWFAKSRILDMSAEDKKAETRLEVDRRNANRACA